MIRTVCKYSRWILVTGSIFALLRFSDHVYFVHPSTDISVDMSTDSRPMYRSTYRPSVDRYVGRHIGRVSVDMSTEICRSTYRPMYRSICLPTLDRYVGRYVDREWLSDCRPTCRSIGYRHSADTSLLLALVAWLGTKWYIELHVIILECFESDACFKTIF